MTTPAAAAGVSPLAELGRQIFNDPSLSASGQLSCASCHSPAYAYGPPNSLAVQLGGPALDRQGARAVPSLRYVLNRTPAWTKNYIANIAERLIEGNEPPAGGFGWDGRFASLHEQAAFPLFSPNEMAEGSAGHAAAALRAAAYAPQLRELYGEEVFADPQRTLAAAYAALERFELEDPSFHPFDSRFDDYLDGRGQLTEQELRGMRLFDDPRQGNCATCHPDRRGADGSHPIFTDYQFEALGVPRNPELVANRDPAYFDLGLCGPLRPDQASEHAYCGMFKTPTLRNVATRATFFHNGRFHTLREALRFYMQRDTAPQQWYPVRGGAIEKFDDLAPGLRGNADTVDEPLTRQAGGTPAWTEAEIDDVIAFLETLNDRDARTAAR